MNLLLPGMYVAADSFLHRLDSRVKMGASMLLMVVPFSISGLVGYLLLTGLVAFAALAAKAPLKALLYTLRTVFWLGLFMFVFHLFTTPGRELAAFWRLSVTWEGVLSASTQVYRLCLLVTVAALLTYTTSASQLSHGLEALMGPLARVGLPVRELGLVLTVALRFVPTLYYELDRISKAQRSRGADPASGGPYRRIRNTVPVFVSVFVGAFRRAEELATAMEARGYRAGEQRTRLYSQQLTLRDWAVAAATLFASATIVVLDRLTSLAQ